MDIVRNTSTLITLLRPNYRPNPTNPVHINIPLLSTTLADKFLQLHKTRYQHTDIISITKTITLILQLFSKPDTYPWSCFCSAPAPASFPFPLSVKFPCPASDLSPAPDPVPAPASRERRCGKGMMKEAPYTYNMYIQAL